MEIKKTPKANLENRRLIFTEIGLVVALLLVLGAFSMGSKEKKIADLQEVEQQVEIEDMVPITQETPPPPPDQPKIPVLSDEIDIVDRHPFLGRVADIPSGLSGRVLEALWDADGIAVGFCGGYQGRWHLFYASAVAVQGDDKRGAFPDSFRNIQAVFPLIALVLHREAKVAVSALGGKRCA